MSASPYPIRQVLPEWRAGVETMGTKQKFWCQADDGHRYLFKYAREGTGEDWAEKIAAEIAAVLGVPHATVDLATFKGHPGTLTLHFIEPDLDHGLVHGNELLQEDRPGYIIDTRYRASQHTVEAVLQRSTRASWTRGRSVRSMPSVRPWPKHQWLANHGSRASRRSMMLHCQGS
ncbi:MAG TPA: HipA family kinase [Candidatus Nanopelagicales bacterium]|nr:HipA family kinase [Candidatus Nanopelagicales bacterium]